jgi:5-methylcytosine-specific restriction endonuclease McrA
MNFYQTKEWKMIRLAVLRRDNFSCRKKDDSCSGNLDVHHLLPRNKKKIESRLFDSYVNLLTLCDKHHRRAEMEYQRVGVTHFLEGILRENLELNKKFNLTYFFPKHEPV